MKKKNTVLIIDGGARGCALVQKYSESPYVSEILSVPGNELMQINSKKKVSIFPKLKTTSVSEIVDLCKKYNVALVDVAQDDAVEAGVTDALLKEGILVSGPTKSAGQIEWDKAWSRDFMKKYEIPHPKYKICKSELEGIEFLKKQKNTSWFIKAAGLAAGKGVLPAESITDAIAAVKKIKKFGESAKIFLIEEALVGEEFSFFVISDGNSYKVVGSAQDHKRMNNYDEGPNTGGMGCVSSPLLITPKIESLVKFSIIKKTLSGMKKEGRPYIGVLYVGGMLVDNEPYVIEFNARWGDPEAEVIVPGIKTDFFLLNYSVASKKLKTVRILHDKKIRVAIALSLNPNPKDLNIKERKIYGIENVLKMKDVVLYGTRVFKKGKQFYVTNGRLLFLVGEGTNVIDARNKAYQAAAMIYIEGNNVHYRTDIGWRDVERMYL